MCKTDLLYTYTYIFKIFVYADKNILNREVSTGVGIFCCYIRDTQFKKFDSLCSIDLYDTRMLFVL